MILRALTTIPCLAILGGLSWAAEPVTEMRKTIVLDAPRSAPNTRRLGRPGGAGQIRAGSAPSIQRFVAHVRAQRNSPLGPSTHVGSERQHESASQMLHARLDGKMASTGSRLRHLAMKPAEAICNGVARQERTALW